MQPALPPRLRPPAQDHVSEHILREQLLSQVDIPPTPHDYDDTMSKTSSPSPPNEQTNLESNTGASVIMSTSADSDGGENNSGDGRKGYGKRELSTSKRAAQNRAAQRAFRQRKEGYIKKLEEQVRDYALLNENYKAVQAENYQLRDYIISLQSRLLESQGEFPQPPGGIDGLHPGSSKQPATAPQMLLHPTATNSSMPSSAMDIGAISQLRASSHQAAPEVRVAGSHETGKHLSDPTYLNTESPSKRPRNSTEMNAAQEALQGVMKADAQRLVTSVDMNGRRSTGPLSG